MKLAINSEMCQKLGQHFYKRPVLVLTDVMIQGRIILLGGPAGVKICSCVPTYTSTTPYQVEN